MQCEGLSKLRVMALTLTVKEAYCIYNTVWGRMVVIYATYMLHSIRKIFMQCNGPESVRVYLVRCEEKFTLLFHVELAK